MRVEAQVGGAALEALAPAWEALYGRVAQASPFQSPAWLLPWLHAFAPEEPLALAAWECERLVGLLPCFIWSDGAGGRQLTLLGNGISDRLDLLAEPGREAEVAAAMGKRLQDGPIGWTRLDWRDLPASSPFLTAPLGEGVEAEIAPEVPCPALALPDAPEAVIAGLPRKRRENLQRRRRRLEEQGALRVRLADVPSLERDLHALLDLHGRRWGERGEAGVLAAPGIEGFHHLAAPALLKAGLLRLHVLELDGRAIAAHYGFQRGARAYSYIHGFEPALAAFGPSAILIAVVLEDAVRSGARVFDFLRGQEGYKYDWGGVDQPQARLQARRP